MSQLRVARIGRNGYGQPIRFFSSWDARQKIAEPFRELIRRNHAANGVGFTKTRRKEVFARRFVVKRAVSVLQEKFANFAGDEAVKLGVLPGARVIENEAKRETGLVMLTDANRVRKFRLPGFDAIPYDLFAGRKVGQHLPRLRIVPLRELDDELEQPRHSIRALEAGPAFA